MIYQGVSTLRSEVYEQIVANYFGQVKDRCLFTSHPHFSSWIIISIFCLATTPVIINHPIIFYNIHKFPSQLIQFIIL